ncbi:amidohydrolase [Halococcus saccharolyticus]|uniref:5-methylthioadenosine/S-adenosylhomocysteine deaminase n=1 Tax=Halococcus saccharolyticus DSM 5350 TaxID=1227455 RepID=M0MH26_9EURY|nr:amidohydrolase [Halococcus saccharolyticus]EMA43989.1 amidohydrolase [Halococcus saccharolyticus DSM 5350]
MTTLEIVGGRVLRPDMTVERADVLADQGTGEILAVGDVPAGDTSLDVTDGLVIPGLVNAHTHVAMALLRGYADDKPLHAWLREDIWPIEDVLEPEDVRAGAELGLVEMIRSGTTGFCDMYFDVGAIVDAVDRAGLRARVGYGSVTVGKDEKAAREELEAGLRVAQEYDGAADGRVSTAFMPHSLTTVDGRELDAFVPRVREAGVPIHIHANETTGEVKPIVDEHDERPLAYAVEHGLLEERDFIAHGTHCDEREIDILAERGAGVVHCPASNMKLASGIAPVQAMVDAGVTVGIGTDGAASNNDLSMFDELRDAAMVGKLAAGDASAVDAPTAFGMATAGSAAVAGFDSGRIAEGKNADLAVVDLDTPHLTPHHDLVSHLVYAVTAADVRHTVCDGRVLMRDREVLTLDADAVRETAERRARAAVERAES